MQKNRDAMEKMYNFSASDLSLLNAVIYLFYKVLRMTSLLLEKSQEEVLNQDYELKIKCITGC